MHTSLATFTFKQPQEEKNKIDGFIVDHFAIESWCSKKLTIM